MFLLFLFGESFRVFLTLRFVFFIPVGASLNITQPECDCEPDFPHDSCSDVPVIQVPAIEKPDRPWLSINLPTVPRSVDYLNPVLDSIAAQLSSNPLDALFDRVRVLVVNNRPGQHDAFDKARARFASDPKGASQHRR
jgi:hypothetical protein